MYSAAIAGMILFGTYFGIMLIGLPIGWAEQTWSERIYYFIILTFLGLFIGVYYNAKCKVLKREPVISSCILLEGGYQLVDSTLRCESGKDPRYTVVKAERIIEPNEQTPCLNCGKILIEHYDISSVKTDEELEVEAWIEYLNAPL